MTGEGEIERKLMGEITGGPVKIFSKIYISGPITGVEDWRDNFLAAEKALRDSGRGKMIGVLNPLRIGARLDKQYEIIGTSPSYADYMRDDIKALSSCDAICMLPGWKRSRGARLEYRIAKILDMQILEYQPDR